MKNKFIKVPPEAIIKPENEFHPIEIKYSKVCRTEQERDLFVDFIAAMKRLAENPTPTTDTTKVFSVQDMEKCERIIVAQDNKIKRLEKEIDDLTPDIGKDFSSYGNF